MENLEEEIKKELASWTPEQREQLVGGYEGHGLMCVVERWYGPENYPQNTPIRKAAAIAQILNNVLANLYVNESYK